MTHEVVRRVEESAAQLAATAEETERLGRLSDASVKLIRDAGVMRLLQPAEFGGTPPTPGTSAKPSWRSPAAAAPAAGFAVWAASTPGRWR